MPAPHGPPERQQPSSRRSQLRNEANETSSQRLQRRERRPSAIGSPSSERARSRSQDEELLGSRAGRRTSCARARGAGQREHPEHAALEATRPARTCIARRAARARARGRSRAPSQTMEEMRGKLAELGKTKDEGWTELNTRIGELDHLREVIAEQERLLERARVGPDGARDRGEGAARRQRALAARVDRAQERARRPCATRWSRAEHQVEALEEEHRRLARCSR